MKPGFYQSFPPIAPPSFMDTPAGMQASLRWNDDGGGGGFVAIPIAPLLFLPSS